MPGYLVACDYGLVPLKEISEADAMRVVADTMIGTKVAEYMASGLPLIINSGVGGLKALMAQYRIGAWFNSDWPEGAADGLRIIQQDYAGYRHDCKLVASTFFSLDNCVQCYHELYGRLLGVPVAVPLRCSKQSIQTGRQTGMPSLTQQAATGVKWTALATGVTAATEVFRNVVLAHFLDPVDFGLMAMVTVVIGLAQMYSDLGVSGAIIYHQDATADELSSLYWLNLLYD